MDAYTPVGAAAVQHRGTFPSLLMSISLRNTPQSAIPTGIQFTY